MLAAAGTASAQTLKAEIPFSFQAAGTRMHPGAYSVRLKSAGSGTIVQIMNEDEGRSVMTLPRSVSTPWNATGASVVLSFACTNGNCELSSLRNDTGAVYTFTTSKKSPETRIATVVLRPDRSEYAR
jgi:putative salt-induced outer membrane protein YdiY